MAATTKKKKEKKNEIKSLINQQALHSKQRLRVVTKFQNC